MMTDAMRETATTEELTTDKALTAAELRDLRRTRGWLFESSEALPDGRCRYVFSVVTGKVERRGS